MHIIYTYILYAYKVHTYMHTYIHTYATFICTLETTLYLYRRNVIMNTAHVNLSSSVVKAGYEGEHPEGISQHLTACSHVDEGVCGKVVNPDVALFVRPNLFIGYR